MTRLKLLAVSLLIAFAPPAAAQTADVGKGFATFLEKDIWPAAKARGVPRATFDAAFAGVTPNLKLPDLQLPGDTAKVEEKNRQAEFQSPSTYFDEKSLSGVAAKGRVLAKTYAQVLARIEKRTGVPGPIILAIWGRESGYGVAKIPYNAFEVLATKAYLSRRKEMFRTELLAALEIVADGHLTVADMRSSWAGALGQPQFMPSKFLQYAVDQDGDGRRDIWKSVPDTLASIGNYLKLSGWVAGRGWGYEAVVPASVSCTLEGPDQGQPISAFTGAGVTRMSGQPFPVKEAKATGHLMMPAGRFGPAFIATPNFYVIKTYNNSDLYALYIGQLADRITGGGAFEGGWKRVEGMTRGDVARLQERLVAKGFDVGGADGLPGFKTRRVIGEVEKKLGLPETCWPSKGLAAKVK